MYPIFLYLDPEEYETCVVVEASDIFVKNARERLKERKLQDKVNVIKGFFEEIELNTDFDFIICSSLLHEVVSPNEVLKQIFRLANNNAVVHINVPNAYSIHRILAKEMGKIEDEHELSDMNRNLQQYKVYDMGALKSQIQDVGFDVLEEGSFFIKPFTHKQMGQMLDNGIIDETVLEGLWKLGRLFPEYGSEIYVNVKKG